MVIDACTHAKNHERERNNRKGREVRQSFWYQRWYSRSDKGQGEDARLLVVILTDATLGRSSFAVGCQEKLMVYLKSKRL